MNKNPLYFLPLILFLGWSLFSIIGDRIYEATADKCSDDYISWKVDTAHDLIKNNRHKSEEKKRLIMKFKNSINQINRLFSPEDQDQFLKYMFLQEQNCPLPDGFEDKIMNALYPVENAGDKICPINAYYKESVVLYNYIKEHKKPTYEKLKKRLYNGLELYKREKGTIAFWKEKWESQEFIDQMISAYVHSMYREQKKCQDINRPLTEVYKNLFRERIKNNKHTE